MIKAQELNSTLDAERLKAVTQVCSEYTVSLLCKKYLNSVQFLDLAPKTQSGYRSIIARIESKAGKVAVSSISRTDLVSTYDDLRAKHGESMAAAMMRVWRILLGYAWNIGWRGDNPCLGLRLKTTKARKSLWTPDQIEAFCAKARELGRRSMALAVELAYDIGQRQADILKLTWSEYDGQGFVLTQGKTGTRLFAAVMPEMQATLAALPRQAVQVVVSEATLKPYKQDHFRHEFSHIRRAAGLPNHLQFRDLRRTAATELGAAGATDDELRAQTGHLSRGVVGVYVVPTEGMAVTAQSKRAAKRKMSRENQP